METFISGLVTHANAAKNSPRWNPSNLSVAHFLFSTAAAPECNSSVTLGMDTEKIDFAFLGFFDFYPSLQEAGVATRAKKSAVKYFSGNPSRANCDHVHWRFLPCKTDGRPGWGELESAGTSTTPAATRPAAAVGH